MAFDQTTRNRLQRFVNKGMAPVTKADQGTVWPSTR